jgi:hypothetical protein
MQLEKIIFRIQICDKLWSHNEDRYQNVPCFQLIHSHPSIKNYRIFRVVVAF